MNSRVQAGRLYIIDYGSSKQLGAAAGFQTAVDLGPHQCNAPGKVERFDPYSFDMYCIGQLLQNFIDVGVRCCPENSVLILSQAEDGLPRPWVVRWYAQWLIGKECDCQSVCHCRPTARLARQVLLVLRFILTIWDFLTGSWTSVRPAHTKDA